MLIIGAVLAELKHIINNLWKSWTSVAKKHECCQLVMIPSRYKMDPMEPLLNRSLSRNMYSFV